jgi:SAM-dependent methyltransferase
VKIKRNKKNYMRNSYNSIPVHAPKGTHERVFDIITKDKKAIIIDVPAGNGAFLKRLVDNNYTNIYAIDINNNLMFKHSNFICADMTKRLPFKDKEIDTFVCIEGIEHIDEQFSFIEEAHRVLKDGGEIIITTPNISSIRSRWRYFLTGHHNKCKAPLDEYNPTPFQHIGMISYPELRYILHTRGFKVEIITSNQIKFVSYIYAICLPLVYLVTSLVYVKYGKKEGTTKTNKEVIKEMFNFDVLFGESLVIKAIKQKIAGKNDKE